jgi:hypothetical protein
LKKKQKAAVLLGQRLDRDRTEAYHDARALAIELASGEPSAGFDPMGAGVVLQPGEIVYRQLPLWIRVQQNGRWAEASYAVVLVTDKRLLCRLSTGRLSSLWWRGVIGLHVDLASEHIVLDFGDAQPVCLSGPLVAPVGIVAIASIYGTEAVLTHIALAPLRTKGSSATKQTTARHHYETSTP